MGLYEFQKDDAYRFADSQMIPTNVKGNEIVFKFCPYCKGGKNRDKGTFSLNLNSGQWECKRGSCGRRGNMITLSQDFNFQLSEDVNRYYNVNNYNNRFRMFKDAHKKYESKPAAIKYMESRGISEEICKRYEITSMSERENVIVFPFKLPDGELKFVKYRNSTFKKGDAGGKEWCEKDCMPILFGMNHCSDFTTLVITEGQMDSLTLSECGVPNAVSVPTGKNGFTWIPHCWDWVNSFEEIVVFGDCENGQISLAEMISTRFPKKTRIARVEDYQGYKDANDIYRNLGKDAVLAVIANADCHVSRRIKPMDLVEAVDVENVPAISTSIPELDKVLTNGFHDGEVVLLTGKRGNGKSTFGNQLVVDAISQDVSSMIYSGELPDFFVKNWIDRQIIGRKSLSNSDILKCNNWYHDRLFIYDNTLVDDEQSELLDVIDEAIRCKGIRFIVLDNLMTALDDCSSNETLYRAQSNFVNRLSKMAKTYKVVFLLVAHPRKSNNAFQNDDVSGSADITNRVDIVMSYDRVDDIDSGEDERKLSITKNRLTGKLGEIRLFYSEESKRIVGSNKNFNKDYFKEQSFESVDQFEIPFD